MSDIITSRILRSVSNAVLHQNVGFDKELEFEVFQAVLKDKGLGVRDIRASWNSGSSIAGVTMTLEHIDKPFEHFTATYEGGETVISSPAKLWPSFSADNFYDAALQLVERLRHEPVYRVGYRLANTKQSLANLALDSYADFKRFISRQFEAMVVMDTDGLKRVVVQIKIPQVEQVFFIHMPLVIEAKTPRIPENKACIPQH